MQALPYFDVLFKKFRDGGEPGLEKAFGLNVHWGYWENPSQAKGSLDDFSDAARKMTRKVYEQAKIKNGMKVLDVGCGFGGTLYELNENFSDMELVGLNIDARQLERAKKLVIPKNGNRVSFIEGTAVDLPFKERSFDAVLAVECIFHFPSRMKFFKEAHRVLKRGGRLAVSDFVPFGPTVGLLAALMVSSYSSLRETYGSNNGSSTHMGYKLVGRKAGFSKMQAVDVTRNTLPTYTCLKELAPAYDSKIQSSHFLKANRFLKWTSATKLLHYKIFDFYKE